MSLVNCPECQAEISESAVKCPKCGVQLIKPTRTIFGNIIKWGFIGFNVIMLIWIIAGTGSAAGKIEGMTGAGRTGAELGTGIGIMLIIVLWTLGDIILGMFVFFTRPKS